MVFKISWQVLEIDMQINSTTGISRVLESRGKFSKIDMQNKAKQGSYEFWKVMASFRKLICKLRFNRDRKSFGKSWQILVIVMPI